MHVFRLFLVLLAVPMAVVLAGRAAFAEPVTIGGITFSDERGGFTIRSASGSGAYDDPFVIVEEITDPQGAVLVIRGAVQEIGNRIGTVFIARAREALGSEFSKFIINQRQELAPRMCIAGFDGSENTGNV